VVAKPLPSGGLLITQILPEGNAAKAKLQVGDVLLKYGTSDLGDVVSLRAAVAAHAQAKSVTLTVWRASAKDPLSVEILPGKLGVGFDNEPAPIAIAAQRKFAEQIARLDRGGSWKDLPGTRIETTRLRQLLGEDCQVLTDGNASEQSLEVLRKSGALSQFRYLHFAAHGEGNNVRAFESALILSQDNLPKDLLSKPGEPYVNGQLSASEVLQYWKLNAELVTLSACQTAIGQQAGGDGLLGFAQAFLTVGSRSVCLSLWNVDDRATALLMSRFYENLLGKREGLSKGMGKAAALDEAKHWLRNLSNEEVTVQMGKLRQEVVRGNRGKGEDLNVIEPPGEPKLALSK